jgi:hypothetical protein
MARIVVVSDGDDREERQEDRQDFIRDRQEDRQDFIEDNLDDND